jgi:hypothetical protein
MYIVVEYFVWFVLLLAIGGLLFVASAAVLVAEEGAKLVASSTRKLAVHAAGLASKPLTVIASTKTPPPELTPGGNLRRREA